MAIETSVGSVETGAEEAVRHLKPPAPPETMAHREVREDEFWRSLPAYKDVDRATFLDHLWQARNSTTKPKDLFKTLEGVASEAFIKDVELGFQRAPMSVRVSPYILSLIDWNDPYNDPLRIQFIPVGGRLLPDHPLLDLDSLKEQDDAPVPGLTHRYPDKALFLPLKTCPVYCRFCTRSYAIGPDTEEVEGKARLASSPKSWGQAFAYIRQRPELEDIVISGGDVYQLKPEHLEEIGMTLLEMPNIRRMRFATKGLAVMPQKILTHPEWTDAITRVVERGRKMHKEVVIHTHFNHPNEFTWISREASDLLAERGVTVRNQTVLQRNVNDSDATMTTLVKRLGYYNIHPYYVYTHDLVKGVEDLRTTLHSAQMLEKHVRGTTAGFNTPTFICDAPGGGGKRAIHSYEYYNRETGIAVYSAPSVKRGTLFYYFDPIDQLSPDAQARWAVPQEREAMLAEAQREAEKSLDVEWGR